MCAEDYLTHNGALVSSIAEATRSEAGWSRGDLRNNLFRNCARPSCIIGY